MDARIWLILMKPTRYMVERRKGVRREHMKFKQQQQNKQIEIV